MSIVAVQGSLGEIEQALKTDEEFFISFNLADELTFPVPDFHKVSFRFLISSEVSKIALALPRNHAKTTLAKLAVVYYFTFTDHRFCVYLSNTSAIAVEACKDIIGFMESDNFRAVFGELKWITRQEGAGFYKFEFRGETRILKAFGANMQVRGLNIDNARPDLLVVDDLEDNENTATPFLREKLKKWVYGPLFKAMNKLKNKIIWLGNMISNDCMLKSHCESEDWHSMRYGCLLSNGEPLWPDLWPLEDIQKDFVTYQREGLIAVWFAEMMNMPMVDGLGLISADKIPYAPGVEPGDITHGFITIDPADSDKDWADSAAIVVHGFVPEKRAWQVVEYTKQRGMGPLDIHRVATEYCYKWRLNVIGIESVALQSVYQSFFKYINMVEGIEGIEVVPVHAHGSKTARIASWCAMLESKEYYLTEGELDATEELLNYDPTKKKNKDDLIDACAYGPQMIQMYMHLIMQTYAVGRPAKELGYHEISAL